MVKWVVGLFAAVLVLAPMAARAEVDPTARGMAAAAQTSASTIDTVNRIRKPRKSYSKIFAAASGVSALKLVPIGDSLAGKKTQQLEANLDRMMGGLSLSGVNTAGTGAAAGNMTAGWDLTAGSLSSATAITGDYNYWLTGSYLSIASGGSAAWQLSASNPTFTRVRVYYVKEPAAGTINLVVGGSTVASASAANATVDLGVLEYTQSVAQASVSTTTAGGGVKVLFVHAMNETVSGIDLYGAFNLGGLALYSATSVPQNVALLKAALTSVAPDLIAFEMDDDFGDGANGSSSWMTFADALDASVPTADKLIIGSTPRAASDAGKIASRDYLKRQVYARGASYMFFDSYSIMGSYADMTSIFGSDDGTHPNVSAEAFAADELWHFLGLNAFNMGYVPRAVNDRSMASRLARGTVFGDGPGRGSLTFMTDATFGLDWQAQVSRTLAVTDTSGTASGWIFSVNTGVTPNQIPTGTRIGSSTGAIVQPGTLDFRIKTSAYTVLTTESGGAYSNQGAGSEVVFTLPGSTGGGLCYKFFVHDSVGLRVKAQTGNTVRNGASVSASGGYIENTTVGSAAEVCSVSGSEWYVLNANGTWPTT